MHRKMTNQSNFLPYKESELQQPVFRLRLGVTHLHLELQDVATHQLRQQSIEVLPLLDQVLECEEIDHILILDRGHKGRNHELPAQIQSDLQKTLRSLFSVLLELDVHDEDDELGHEIRYQENVLDNFLGQQKARLLAAGLDVFVTAFLELPSLLQSLLDKLGVVRESFDEVGHVLLHFGVLEDSS